MSRAPSRIGQHAPRGGFSLAETLGEFIFWDSRPCWNIDALFSLLHVALIIYGITIIYGINNLRIKQTQITLTGPIGNPH